MSVGADEARRIARLAHLELEGEELERLTHELNRILGHVVALEGLDLEDLRDVGAPTESLPPARAEAPEGADPLVRPPADVAPDWRDGFFVVPALPGLSDGAGETP